MTAGRTPGERTLGDVDALFRSLADDDVAPGVAYGVIGRTGLIHAGGHGRVAAGGSRPDAATAFRIASMTKSFTAASVMLLAERGALSLADPISRHVPEFAAVRLPTSDSPQVTVGMLLSMSGGLPTDDAWADRQESMSREDFGRLLTDGVRFAAVPGTVYEYSNLGYAILGCMVAGASGLTYHEFVERHLIGPLGLTSTGFAAPAGARGGIATGHVRRDGHWEALPFSAPGVFSAIGGLFSTVEDLTRWVCWLADAFPPRDDEDPGPLSRASRRTMQQVQRVIPPSGDGEPTTLGYGFGLVIERDPVWGTVVSHNGGYPGFGSHMRWHPATGLGVVTLANARYVTGSAKAVAALRAVLTDVADPPARTDFWPETLTARAAVERLLRDWNPAEATSLFADNVELDLSLNHRQARIERMTETVGPLLEPTPSDELIRSDSPGHLVWNVHGTRGVLRCEIELNPQNPPKIQTLDVTIDERTPSTADAVPETTTT